MMSILEWLILGVIFALGAAACVFVRRLEKQGHHVPGSMCAGCPHTATVDKKD